MGLDIRIRSQALEDLDALDPAVAKRIIKKFAKPLRQPAVGDLRFRIGEYRAVAIIDIRKKRIEIIAIGHRSDIYH